MSETNESNPNNPIEKLVSAYRNLKHANQFNKIHTVAAPCLLIPGIFLLPIFPPVAIPLLVAGSISAAGLFTSKVITCQSQVYEKELAAIAKVLIQNKKDGVIEKIFSACSSPQEVEKIADTLLSLKQLTDDEKTMIAEEKAMIAKEKVINEPKSQKYSLSRSSTVVPVAPDVPDVLDALEENALLRSIPDKATSKSQNPETKISPTAKEPLNYPQDIRSKS